MSSHNLRKEKDCLNCGQYVEKTYCSNCGQQNIELKENAWQMIVHAIVDYFHFDHQFLATFRPLLFSPGKVSVDYVEGKRARYLHPIKLYIFVSIVFFIFVLGGEKKLSKKTEFSSKSENKEVIDAKIALEENIVLFGENEIKTVEAYETAQSQLPKQKRDGIFKHYFKKKQIEFNQYEKPGEKLKEDLIKNIPKGMFLLLPLTALMLKLIYFRKKKYYFEHLIYSFNTHAALFVAMLIGKLIASSFGLFTDKLDTIIYYSVIAYMVWYMYKSLKVFYGGSGKRTVANMFLMTFVYLILMSLCLFVIATISFIMV